MQGGIAVIRPSIGTDSKASCPGTLSFHMLHPQEHHGGPRAVIFLDFPDTGDYDY
jgi:hypothetical protein